MTRFRRIPPAIVFALGAFVPAAAVAVAGSEPDSTASETSAPESTEVTDPSDVEADPARRLYLESIAEADEDSFAGGAELRELVDGKRVLMIGDSILASTSRRYGGEMCGELEPLGWEVEIDAEVGRFVDFGKQVLDARLEAEWDVAVVMLGNNYGADKDVFEDYLRDIVDRLAPRPTVLLTVSLYEPNRADVNAAIYETASDFDNVRVADWSKLVAGAPELLGPDGLHLSNDGRAAFAELVADELGDAPGIGEGDCLGSDFTDDSAITSTVPGQVPMPSNTWPTTGGGGGDDDAPTTTAQDDGVGGSLPTDSTPTATIDDGTGGGGGGGATTTQPAPTTPEPSTTPPQATTPPTTVAPPPAPPPPPPPDDSTP